MSLEKTQYPVSPADIDSTQHFYDAFDHMETEISARYIVRMLQERGEWSPFTREEIEDFYQKCGLKDGFRFNRLIRPGIVRNMRVGSYEAGGGWINERADGSLEVTEEFVRRVYKSSPVVTEIR